MISYYFKGSHKCPIISQIYILILMNIIIVCLKLGVIIGNAEK